MKANELINKLQEAVQKLGDRDVVTITEGTYGFNGDQLDTDWNKDRFIISSAVTQELIDDSEKLFAPPDRSQCGDMWVLDSNGLRNVNPRGEPLDENSTD